ncbi:SurA N-terminal domain-containing protein [Nisaea acidiphila]|uniref:Parvulin-like PPIase n=1 Tax=Nisaea acidiphila TaxID=1862145 RepID=A0A9J7ARH6_9PROT|nr:SurA N-terminal domain-containing protein [Nisaea acidiphila]UUX50211.1 SurA N-terminal domain-containing protein [Nisaea acidiphila]
MLQLIRSRVTSIFVKALFVLLIASFAVWGIGDIFLGSPTGKAAIEVGDVEVTTAEVLDEFERVRRNMGVQVTAQEAAQFGLLEQVMNDLANRALFMAEAGDLGLAVGDDQIKRQIAEMPAFRDQTGRFNPDLFRQALFRAQLSEGAFLNLLREEIRRDQIVNAVTAGFSAPDVQRDAYYRYRNEERAAKLVTLDASSLPAPPTPTESEIDSFYNENKERYRAPEYRSATVLSLTADALAVDIEVPEDRLREAYESRLDEFRSVGRRTVDQIFLADKDTADKAAAALGEGRSFEQVAGEIAEMSPDALSLGSVTRADLDGTALADAIFTAELNTPTAPVESDLGWHIFRVTEIVPESTKPFDEVKDQVKREVAHNEALDKIFEIANQIEDSLAAGDTIEEAAKVAEVPVQAITDIDRQGLGKDGGTAEGIAADARFRTTLFQTPAQEQSQLEETQGGGYFILRVDGITKAAIRPLDEVEERVTADLVAERRADANLKRAQALVQQAASGGLEAAAEAAGLEVQTLAPFTRTGDGLPDGLPADVAEIAFDLKISDIGMSEDLSQIHIAELTAINEADPAAAGDVIEPLARQIQSGMAADAVALLIAALRESHNVTIDAGLPLAVINGDVGGPAPQQSGGLF